MKIAIFCCLYAFCFCLADVESISCESISDEVWVYPVGKQKTCFMTETTVIDSPGVSIASTADESVEGLSFRENKKIKFLPVNPATKFPNLVGYVAYSCSIETIIKENFKALSKLKLLYLDFNKIEKVSSNVFEDLTALEFLWLEDNKIKFINSAAFRGLSKLRDVDFDGNVCIQGRNINATGVATMIPTLNDKCGFSEDPFLLDFARKTSDQVNKVSESIKSNRQEQEVQANTLNTLIRETKAEVVKSRDENAKAFANLEVELKTGKNRIEELQKESKRYQQEQIKSQETIARQETELKILREQNQKLNDELKVNLETMKTQMKENKDSAVKLALCDSKLNAERTETKAATDQLEQKQANNEELQSKVSDIQIAKAQMEGKVKTLNQQMEHRTLELENVRAENEKYLIKIDQQATTIASLITRNEILSNDFKSQNDTFKECEREKTNIDDNLKLANSKLDVFKGIDIGKFREEIRSEFDLLRNKYNCVG